MAQRTTPLPSAHGVLSFVCSAVHSGSTTSKNPRMGGDPRTSGGPRSFTQGNSQAGRVQTPGDKGWPWRCTTEESQGASHVYKFTLSTAQTSSKISQKTAQRKMVGKSPVETSHLHRPGEPDLLEAELREARSSRLPPTKGSTGSHPPSWKQTKVKLTNPRQGDPGCCLSCTLPTCRLCLKSRDGRQDLRVRGTPGNPSIPKTWRLWAGVAMSSGQRTEPHRSLKNGYQHRHKNSKKGEAAGVGKEKRPGGGFGGELSSHGLQRADEPLLCPADQQEQARTPTTTPHVPGTHALAHPVNIP